MDLRITSIVFLAFAACGGSDERHHETTPHHMVIPQAHDDGFEVTGTLGTIDQAGAHAALEQQMDAFTRCYGARLQEVEYLAGHVVLAFRIAGDGTVRWVYVHDSTVGDRDTERCLVRIARQTRFPAPHGGEAELTYPLDFEPGEEVRMPLEWRADRVVAIVQRGRPQLESCASAGSVTVTAYVAPGGQVQAVGAAVHDRAAADGVDCVVDAVRGWTFPDPGSYAAKVTFSVD